MPELPEVETVCSGLRGAFLDKRVSGVILNRPDLRVPFPDNLDGALSGRRVERVDRRAKYILMYLDSGDCLAMHLGMSGRISIVDAGDSYQSDVHDHMIVHFEGGQCFVFNDPRRFGMVFWVEKGVLDRHSAFAHLGPEPLSDDFDGVYLKKRLAGRTSAIKQAIMDQRIVVGVGNIYACEALYRAGINPTVKAGTLSRAKLDNLVMHIKCVLEDAIRSGGSSLKDYRQADGTLGYFQHRFAVYNKEHDPCPDCACDVNRTQGVRRIVQGGRSTFYCPVRQR